MKKLAAITALLTACLLGVSAAHSQKYYDAHYGKVSLEVVYEDDVEKDYVLYALRYVTEKFGEPAEYKKIRVSFYEKIESEGEINLGLTIAKGNLFRVMMLEHDKIFQTPNFFPAPNPTEEQIEDFYKSIFVHEMVHVFFCKEVKGRARNEYFAYAIQLLSLPEEVRDVLILNVGKGEQIPVEAYDDGMFICDAYYNTHPREFMVLSYLYYLQDK